MEFEHPVWNAARKAKTVTYDLKEHAFSVYLGEEKLTDDEIDHRKQMYESLGWTIH